MAESLKTVTNSGTLKLDVPSLPSSTTIIVGFWHKNEETAATPTYFRSNKNTLAYTTATGEANWIVGNCSAISSLFYYNDNAVVSEDGLGASRYVGDIAFFNNSGYTEPEIEGWTYHVHMYHYNSGAGEITYGSWMRLPNDTTVREEAYAVWTIQELRDFADGIANPHPTSSGVSGENTTPECDDMVFNGTISSMIPLYENSTQYSAAVSEDTTNYWKNLSIFTSSTKPTDEQILAWSEATASNPPAGCWGFYPLCDSGSLTYNDFSGNARHLTNNSTGTLSVATIEPDPIITSITTCTITDVGTENYAANATGVPITGLFFEATQASGIVEIGSTNDYGTALLKEVTVTSWADTAIEVSLGIGVEDGFTLGTLYLYVTNDSAEVSPAYAITVYPVFDYFRRPMIDALIAAGAEAHGWNVEKANIPVTALVRTDVDTATLTIPALGGFVITADDVIAAPTIPAGVLTSGEALEMDNGFTITNETDGIEGSTNLTFAPLTTSSAAKLTIESIASITLAPLTASSNSSLALNGEASITLAPLSTSSDGSLSISATSSITLAALTTISEASLSLNANAGIDLAALTTSSAASLGIEGASGITFAPLTVISVGSLSYNGINAEASITFAPLTMASAGTLSLTGVSGITLQALTTISEASLSLNANAGINLAALTTSSAASLGIEGASGITFAPLTVISVGSLSYNGINAEASITFAPLTMVSAGTLSLTGVSGITLQALTTEALASILISATGGGNLQPLTTIAMGIFGLVENVVEKLDINKYKQIATEILDGHIPYGQGADIFLKIGRRGILNGTK
jgi:hypothetical protein